MYCLLDLSRGIGQTDFVNWSRQKPNTTWLFMEAHMPVMLYSTITVSAVWIVQQLYCTSRKCGHVMWVPCHHGMVHPQVADGHGPHIWRVAANILNKQSRIADKGWSSSFGVRVGLTISNRKIYACYKMPQKPSCLDYLDKRPTSRKVNMIFRTWNVRRLYRAGSIGRVAKEISKYKLYLVGVQEVRWDGGGTEPVGEYTFFYRKVNENHELNTGFSYIRESYQQLRG
jgi:hypothetical protein